MRFFAFIVGALTASVEAGTAKRSECIKKTSRMPWRDLTAAEKSNYIQADLCLMELPAKSIASDSVISRWDELQYTHIAQVDYIHEVGAFLPWHRYFVTIHEHMIQTECNYTGPSPYWDEPVDVGNIAGSVMFDTELDASFGSNGTGSKKCVQDGLFANTILHVESDLSYSEYCLSRNFDDGQFNGAAQSAVDECMAKETFIDFWHCIERGPHAAGHGGIGGTMIDVSLSPGDAMFYLHHTYLDKLFWDWQSQNLTARLKEIGGSNTQDSSAGGGLPGGLDPGNFTAEPAANDPRFVEYFNDGGNVTTLDHTLWSTGIMANATIADVMDVTGDYVCAEYF